MNAPRVLRNPAVGSQQRVLVGPTPAPAPANLSGPSVSPGVTVPPALPTVPVAVAMPAFDAGHEEGLRRGLADAKARIDREIETRWQALKTQSEQAERRRQEEHGQRLAALDALLQTVQKAMPERFLALERQAIELAYEALCRVCGPHAGQSPGLDRAGLLADLLRQGVHQLRGQPWLGVRLHPKDHAALIQSEAGRGLLDQHPQLRTVIDATLEPMGAVIDSDHGQLDVGLGTQLARLRELWAHAGEDDAEAPRAGGAA